MRTYLIAYDVAKASAARHSLATEIMSLGQAWARPLEATWYVRAENPQDEIESRLRLHLDTDDGLLIQPVREDAVMLNTGLRWFRQRRLDTRLDGQVVDNVVAFPVAPQVIGDARAA